MNGLVLIVVALGVGMIGGGLLRGAVGNPVKKAKKRASRFGRRLWNWGACIGLVVLIIWIINIRNGAAV